MSIGLNSPLIEVPASVTADGPRKAQPSRSFDLSSWQKKFLVASALVLFIGLGIQLFSVLMEAEGDFATGIEDERVVLVDSHHFRIIADW